MAIKPQMDAGKVLKYGVETTAYVISMNSNLTLSTSKGNTTTREKFYYLKLSYVNSDGQEIITKTGSVYTFDFLSHNDVYEEGIIDILYLGKKAVVKGFTPEYRLILFVFPIVFGLIALGFLILFSIVHYLNARDYIIRRYGTLGTGTYLDQKVFLNNNKSDLNKIIFSFINEKGELYQANTRYAYDDADTEKLRKMESFPIKYLGKLAIIISEEKNKNN